MSSFFPYMWKHQLKTSFTSIYYFFTEVLKIIIPQLMHMYIFAKWKVHLVIAKEIMALITAAPLGVCLQSFVGTISITQFPVALFALKVLFMAF